MNYMAICPKCDKMTAVCVIDERFAKDTAKDVARWIKRGDSIIQADDETVRSRGVCRCGREKGGA